ncbi:hypothetical protein ABC347_15040 [Sphingomonas sp. 1P06PA]|uniref:hypothetical protein n=1 Tax=Sphingomonas sp. 1P06PA TaxID=554121 RepID=UPI0039A67AB5
MTARDFRFRAIGATLFLAGCATSLLHREAIGPSPAAPPGGLEAALALATFMLALTGVMLLIGGADWLGRDRQRGD